MVYNNYMLDEPSAEILELLEEKKYADVKLRFSELYPVDIADIFDDIEDADIMLRLFRLIPKNIAADAFAYMDNDTQERIIDGINDVELSQIINDMFLDDCVDLVEELPANVIKRVMRTASSNNRRAINQFLSYPENSAGSIMTNEYVYLHADMVAVEALSVIRKTAIDKETIDYCYVTTRDNRLEGVVSLRTLVLSEPETPIAELMNANLITVNTTADQEDIALLFSKYDMLALPVVDQENRLVGIITIDDAVDVIQDENTEDFERMAGVAPSDDQYLKTPVWKLARNRIVWLMILMSSAMCTEGLINSFQSAFANNLILVAFIPMLTGTGGNSGSQASTMIIRGMALDEIHWKDFFVVWWKEIRVAFLCGVSLAAVNFARIVLLYPSEPKRIVVALVVSLALILTVILAKSMGCILPMIAKKIKLDPAIMAAPLITTITDACSILIYFTIARVLLGIA